MAAITVELLNDGAMKLLQDLEDLNIIRLEMPFTAKSGNKKKKKLSDKYRGVLSQTEGRNLDQHISKMRNEWANS